MKTVYFVRHGETKANREKFYQDETTPLSEHGLKQAEFVAERFTRIPIEVVITSDMRRAVQTAEAIVAKTGVRLVHSPLFRELLRPSELRGRSHIDVEAMRILRFIKNNFEEGRKYSDEENFFDLKARAQESLKFLEVRPEAEIGVVTHGTYSHMLIALMAFGTALTPHEFLVSDHFFYSSNTGITKCVFKEGGWRLWTWNDYAHLG